MPARAEAPRGYLTPRALEGLRQYKYKPGGYTFLDVVHAPIWDFCTNQLPMWLAPNLITLTGLVFVMISYAITWWYLPDFTGVAPPWVYLLAAIAVVLYVNLDCLDGKQARRTRSSSPLGQLFDHGCDAISVGLLLDAVHTAVDYPCNWISSLAVAGINVPWMLAHWEEYHTGAMTYGNGWFGILEANYSLAAVHLVTYLLGPSVWDLSVDPLLPAAVRGMLAARGYSLEGRHLFFGAGIVLGAVQAWGQIMRVMTFDPKKLPEQERGCKELGTAARLQHLAYLVVLVGLGCWWLSDPTPEKGLCRASSFTYTLVYALVATQLILAHMAKEPMLPSAWAYLVLLAGGLNSYLRVVDPRVASVVLAGLATVGYLNYVVSAVNQIAEFLGVGVFVIRKVAQQ